MIYKHLLTYLLTYKYLPSLFCFGLIWSRRVPVVCTWMLYDIPASFSMLYVRVGVKEAKKPYLLIKKMKSVAQDEVCGAGSELY